MLTISFQYYILKPLKLCFYALPNMATVTVGTFNIQAPIYFIYFLFYYHSVIHLKLCDSSLHATMSSSVLDTLQKMELRNCRQMEPETPETRCDCSRKREGGSQKESQKEATEGYQWTMQREERKHTMRYNSEWRERKVKGREQMKSQIFRNPLLPQYIQPGL